ncbi:MAG: hypothetical protein IAG13_22780, partial [Deltaproteobacteria bacterium]|nr:hypothetical protein [Nannocystaceae bacterium]
MAISAAMMLAGALAAPPTIELRWVAPAECPQHAELRARTATRIGAEVDAEVVASPSDYVLTLDVSLPDAAPVHRELAALRCDDLVDAAALMIAVAV